MKLEDYKQDFYTFTGKLSDINRQIAFAGIALIWIFKKSNGIEITICAELVFPSILLASALAFDILQYIYQSAAWAIFFRYHEKRSIDENQDILAPSFMNYFSWFCFIMKVLLVIISYIYIIRYLLENLIKQ